MALMMRVGHFDIDLDTIKAIAEKHRLSELSIFGSALRDDFRPDSDVDMLFQPIDPNAMDIATLVALREDLEGLFGRKVDLAQRSLVQNPFMRHAILTSRRKLYVSPAA